jgi:hypothetical protein
VPGRSLSRRIVRFAAQHFDGVKPYARGDLDALAETFGQVRCLLYGQILTAAGQFAPVRRVALGMPPRE